MMVWECASDGTWIATRLPAQEAFVLEADASVIRWSAGRQCGLLVRGDVQLNGAPALPFQVLQHRDEIRVGARLFCFSVASPSEPAPFVPVEHDVHCARCGVVLEREIPVLFCPHCRAPHHTDCFDCAPKCGACAKEMSWMPEAIGSEDPWRH